MIMATINLQDFFHYFKLDNPNQLTAVGLLEKSMPTELLLDNSEWVVTYRTSYDGTKTTVLSNPSKIYLRNFFQYFNPKNVNQVNAVKLLQTQLPTDLLSDTSAWVVAYRKPYNPPEASDISLAGINLIKEFEGFYANAYVDPLSGYLPITIGWGSTFDTDGSRFHLGQTVTRERAQELLIYECEKKCLPSLRGIPYWNEMSDGQHGALLSFSYNLGAGFYGGDGFGTITRKLRDKAWDEVPNALLLYINPGSNVEEGLRRRRKAEGDLWRS